MKTFDGFPMHTVEFETFVNSIRDFAEKKKHVFELSDSVLNSLFYSDCSFCLKIEKEKLCKNVGLFVFSKGYKDANVFPICDMCQRIRHGLTKTQVIALALHTVIHSPLVDKINGKIENMKTTKMALFPHPCVRSYSTNYNTYRGSARRRCLSPTAKRCPSSIFTLTRNQFEALRKLPCYYCGLVESNGVDRLHPTIGYTLRNCVPCCKTCNYAKKNLHPAIYIGHLLRILRKNFT